MLLRGSLTALTLSTCLTTGGLSRQQKSWRNGWAFPTEPQPPTTPPQRCNTSNRNRQVRGNFVCFPSHRFTLVSRPECRDSLQISSIPSHVWRHLPSPRPSWKRAFLRSGTGGGTFLPSPRLRVTTSHPHRPKCYPTLASCRLRERARPVSNIIPSSSLYFFVNMCYPGCLSHR